MRSIAYSGSGVLAAIVCLAGLASLHTALARQSGSDPTGRSNTVSSGSGSGDDSGDASEDLIHWYGVRNHLYANGSYYFVPNHPAETSFYYHPWDGNNRSEIDVEVQLTKVEALQRLETMALPETLVEALQAVPLPRYSEAIGNSVTTYADWYNSSFLKGDVTNLSNERYWIVSPVTSETARDFHFLKFEGHYNVSSSTEEPVYSDFETVKMTIPAGQSYSDSVDLKVEPTIVADNQHWIDLYFGNIALAADHNRNGIITFDGKDATTTAKPFRFWVNNDAHIVESDEPIEVTNEDSMNQVITTNRDLEDFCRLRLRAGIYNKFLRDGDIQIGLKIRNVVSGTPKIRIWPNQSPDGDDAYLKDDTKAEAQRQRACYPENEDGVILIPKEYWDEQSMHFINDPEYSLLKDRYAHLIFEGVSKGEGELAIVIFDKDGNPAVEIPGMHLKLMDVRNMYQRARIVNEAENIDHPWIDDSPPAQTWNWDPNGIPYVEDPAAEAVTAVFVHGWRMPYSCYINWADTSYKRLWQQGFKGKFYSFRWPTYSADNTIFRNNTFDDWQEMNAPVPPGGFTYNPSEYRAWLCGPALASFVNQLPNPARRNLFAHSMGNVVSGAALRAGMKLTNYALCNAAVSAMAYDTYDNSRALIPAPAGSLLTNLNTVATPDNDDYLSIRQAYGLADKFNVPSNGTFSMPVVSNFGLPNDAALGQWSSNNEVFKPQIFGLSAGSYNYVALGPSAGRLAFAFDNNGDTAIRDVTAPAEAFSYITKSKTRAAGAELRTRGIIATENVVNMGAAEFNFGETHSAVWRWNNQSTNLFWAKLVKQLELKD